ncbi:M14 family metallopeptidase [Alicyclobacillus dauci]|uniref:M14 family metallopeptidase n=1 Tax=Alicyclobacillus dauci TaxID=1475485 RepID=A0ABY6Z0K1_9BACL|nr:M14 family metallopeptidase [Alicyclobacillus dauci]WAH36280.1 M14 family metallopeptidase [Alicyclobacillus dauci]
MRAQYWTYQAMWDELNRLQREHPNLISVEVIGHSREGRDIAGVTLTSRSTGAPERKSAVFVDANIHAGEVSSNSVAMFWIHWCIENYGQDREATELLDQHTVYVVPRISLDGAELYLTTPARFRSSPHTYPYSEPPEGFVAEDVNGDGYILQMRVQAEDGGFVIDDVDPRVMRPRRPGEIGGQYYHVFPEGRIDHLSKTGALPAFAMAQDARRSTMDYNRNFPIRWAGESGQPGAGPYPLSEPELRALAEFIHAHPNIAAYAALHTSGGVILRQPSTGDDTVLSETDRDLFTRVADMGAQVSGYFAGSNYNKFATGHEKVLMPGAADDWMYDHFGVMGFTVEIWNLNKRAGAHGYGEHGMRRMMALTPEELTEDQRKIFAWVEKEVPDHGVFEWTAFEHPDFGKVEIGGLNPKFVIQNPPIHFLEEECTNVSAFLTKLGLSTPKLMIPTVQVTEEGVGVFRLVAEVSNAGFLPTSSTEKGKELLLEGVRAMIEGQIEVIAGMSPVPLGHLDGYGSQSTFAPPKSQRGYAEWVVKGEPGTNVKIVFEGPRSGRVEKTVLLTTP